jgi:type IV secretion system protein VirB6
MSACPAFGAAGPASIADALSKVDCLTAEATQMSFNRLFGPGGSLTPALTILLTLYVAFFAVNLLTGRSTLRLSLMTPKMMTMGLVLTFVTSWIAYQSVVWNLAVGAPDQVASVLLGSSGSATHLFADRLDALFTAVTNAANSLAGESEPGAKLASPSNMLWISALMLLLGTVGVLVVCRIALAALLMLGPVFIVLALFQGTRGLFEGWLKSVVAFAMVPLLTVVMGSGAVITIMPMVQGLATSGGEISLRTSVGILVASMVYFALMFLVIELARSLTSGWKLGKSAERAGGGESAAHSRADALAIEKTLAAAPAADSFGADRVRSTIASLSAASHSSRVPAMSAAGSGSSDVAALQRAIPSEASAGRHSLYFSHRTQAKTFNFSREIIR